MNEWATVAVALIVPIGTLIYTSWGLKSKAEADYVQRLEKRLVDCELSRDALVKRLGEQAEEIESLKRILTLFGIKSQEPKP